MARYALAAAIAAPVVLLVAGSFRWTPSPPAPARAAQHTVGDAGTSQAGTRPSVSGSGSPSGAGQSTFG